MALLYRALFKGFSIGLFNRVSPPPKKTQTHMRVRKNMRLVQRKFDKQNTYIGQNTYVGQNTCIGENIYIVQIENIDALFAEYEDFK